MKKIFIFLLIALVANCYEEKHGTIRVDLFRQKTPREQYLTYGTYWLTKDESNTSVPIFRYSDNELYGKILVGKPGQPINVAFDVAWSQSWMLSSKCSSVSTPGCMFHNLYNHDTSSSYKKDGRPFSMDVGPFNLTGFYSYDTISVGASNVTGFSFVEITDVPTSFFLSKADGAVGLGTRYGDYEPFLYALYRQKKVRDPIFSIYLNRDRHSQNAGNLMLGFVDKQFIHKTQYPNKTVIPDSIKYLRADPGINWKINVDNIVITPNQTTPMKNITLCSKGCKAIPDTSSYEILGPVDDVNKILALINAKKFLGRWTVPCDTVNKLPRIDFVFGGQKFSLDGPQYTFKTSVAFFKICVSVFTPTNYASDGGLWILGGSFLSQYYSVYNIVDATVGFVKAA